MDDITWTGTKIETCGQLFGDQEPQDGVLVSMVALG